MDDLDFVRSPAFENGCKIYWRMGDLDFMRSTAPEFNNGMESMEDEAPFNLEFEVKFVGKSIVKATNHSPVLKILTLSNLDLLSGRFPVTYFYFYRRRRVPVDDFRSVMEALKSSLSETLNHFYPFAGTIVENPDTGEPEIDCNNGGALVVEALANIPLKKLNFYDLDKSLRGKLVAVNASFPLQIQVTEYTCGGISLTFTFDHALGDASSFGKFLLSWSELARKKPISAVPDHRRSLRPRSPPSYHPSLDEAFVKCTMEDLKNIPLAKPLIKRLYHVEESAINLLQKLASINGGKRTKIEAFSAYTWKVMGAAINESYSNCKMGWLVDGRTRMGIDQNYIGNLLSVAFGESAIEELNRSSISEVASRVNEAISKVTNKEHFLDLIDWIECHRPGLMLSRNVLGLGGAAMVVSSGRRFPVAELEFVFGRPVLGTVCSTIERIGVNYLNQRPSGRDDGSWTVSAILWPELASALEKDSIYQPMSATLLDL